MAAIAAFFAGRMSGCLAPALTLALGVLGFWVAIFIGVDMGYRGWQAMPDPPPEAFSDASAVGALVFGWIPGGILCLILFAFMRICRRLLRWANPDLDPPPRDTTGESSPVRPKNSKDPYQIPSSPTTRPPVDRD